MEGSLPWFEGLGTPCHSLAAYRRRSYPDPRLHHALQQSSYHDHYVRSKRPRTQATHLRIDAWTYVNDEIGDRNEMRVNRITCE